jgi:hypothetical protein
MKEGRKGGGREGGREKAEGERKKEKWRGQMEEGRRKVGGAKPVLCPLQLPYRFN